MKRFLLLALTAGLLSPIAAMAETKFTDLEPINPYSYQKSSLVRWDEKEKRYIGFKGSTKLPACFGGDALAFCDDSGWKGAIKNGNVVLREDGIPIWNYKINCTNKKYR